MENVNEPLLEACETSFAGKLFCYTSVGYDGGGGYVLSVVVDGERGHQPLSPSVAYGSQGTMLKLVADLNRDRLRLPADSVVQIIAQSMRGR
jgi:hypothetical protein